MINYNTLSKKVKANLLSYSNKLTLGLFRTDMKFVAQMVYGLTVSSSSYLSDIARSLNESITIKKSTRLCHFIILPYCLKPYKLHEFVVFLKFIVFFVFVM